MQNSKTKRECRIQKQRGNAEFKVNADYKEQRENADYTKQRANSDFKEQRVQDSKNKE